MEHQNRSMNTVILAIDQGKIYSFSFENAYVTLGITRNILMNNPEISNIKLFRWSLTSGDKRITFRFRDIDYVIYEPFGDNSDYFVEPVDSKLGEVDLTDIQLLFEEYKPPILLKLVGDIISLKFITIVFKSLYRCVNKNSRRS